MLPPAGSGAATAIMRLRVALLGVKPTAWRRIEVAVTATLADLRTVSDDDTIPRYGATYKVRLTDLRLRAGERFSYVYNHSAPWEHQLRVEAVGPGALGRQYPRCVAGQHACPPEWNKETCARKAV